MSERAQELAGRFEQANEEFIGVVERLSDAEWATECPEERRTVAALSRHIAFGYGLESRYLRAIASGRPLPLVTRERLNALNAEHGEQYAHCDKAEVLAMLRREGAAAADFVRGLSDDELARSGDYVEGLPTWTVDTWIERILIGHIGMHLASIRAAVASPTA